MVTRETIGTVILLLLSYVIARIIYFGCRDFIIHKLRSYLVKRREMAEKRRMLARAKLRLKT